MRMYSLLCRVHDGLPALRTQLQTHVEKKGLAAVDQVGDVSADAKVYVDTLLAVHQRYLTAAQENKEEKKRKEREKEEKCY